MKYSFSFLSWKKWVGSLPWSYRWFVYLIVLRPIADNFYHLKRLSPFASPPYIIGVLTPVLIFLTLFSKNFKRISLTTPDKFFLMWSLFLYINSFFLWLYQPSLSGVGAALKLSMPSYIYFFLRRFINSKRDLEKILQTSLYAAIIPAVIFLYEIIFTPIRITYRGELERLQGGFGDVISYGIYIVLVLLVLGYFLLIPKFRIFKSMNKFKILFIIAICSVGLLKIVHVATFGVVFAILGIFLFYKFRQNKLQGLILILALFMVVYISFKKGAMEEKVMPLVGTDIRIFEGEGRIEGLFHGRGYRWIDLWGYFNEAPAVDRLIGISIRHDIASSGVLGRNPHNDYLRILFYTGYIGLFFYLLTLISVFVKSFNFYKPEQFLINGALLIIILYSISALPMLYAPLLYIVLAIIAYSALSSPRQVKLVFSNAR